MESGFREDPAGVPPPGDGQDDRSCRLAPQVAGHEEYRRLIPGPDNGPRTRLESAPMTRPAMNRTVSQDGRALSSDSAA